MVKINKWVIIGVCAAVVIAGASWGGYYFMHRKPNPAKMSGEQVMKFMQSQDFNSMPREQRREFFTELMDSRVQGYFNAPAQEKTAYLDKIIDDMQKFRPNFQAMRPPRDPNFMQRMRQMRQQYANATPEQRRARREMRDPVKSQMAREFFEALRNRAQQRGIQMGGFGRGFGGGDRGR